MGQETTLASFFRPQATLSVEFSYTKVQDVVTNSTVVYKAYP